MSTSRYVMIAALAALTLPTIGCVAQSEYDKMRDLYLRNMEQTVELEQQAKQQQARIDQLERENSNLAEAIAGKDKLTEEQITEMNELIAALQAERDKLTSQNDQLKTENQLLIDQGVALKDPVLNEALRKFAEENNNVVTYDQARGMVKFRSDFTFGLGSDQLSPEAAKALADLAKILNSSAARKFEVKVVGHTDNLPIVRAETKQKFGNNWILSVFRANSVRKQLQAGGVNAKRTMIAGYGQFRPIAPATKAGNARNRRVEIYLTPMTITKMETATPVVTKSEPAPALSAKTEEQPEPVDYSQFK